MANQGVGVGGGCLIVIFALAATSMVLGNLTSPGSDKTPEPALTRERTTPVAIDPGVDQPYTESSFPTYFAAWGADGMSRVERTRRGAARIAARSFECDRVEIAELSQYRSLPPSRIVVFVDCTNRKRFWISEDEVIAAGH